MGLKKCPKCELNYIRDEEKVCDVCRRLAKKEMDLETDETEPICIECGENPAVPGSEYCALCLRELRRQARLKKGEEDLDDDTAGLDALDVIEVPIEDVEDIPETEMEEIDRELSDGLDDGEEVEDEDFDTDEDELD